MSATKTSIRIDNLLVGSVVLLDMNGRYEEKAMFMGIEGEGDDRQAKFLSVGNLSQTYEWSAYRYNSRWVFGSSAERMSVLDMRSIIELLGA